MRLAQGRASPSVGYVLICAAVVLAGCGVGNDTPAPTPGDIETVAAKLALQGIFITDVVGGDAGCDDRSLAGPAISFMASGLDQAAPVTIHLYSFRSKTVFEGRRDAVDACARSYVRDPATYENFAVSPFIAAGQGPWAPVFKSHLQAGLTAAAGNEG